MVETLHVGKAAQLGLALVAINQQQRAEQALNRLAKWRALLTGWQLGTRAKGDPEGDAVRDHREATLLLRAEQNALAALLIAKGVFTIDEYHRALAQEADELNQDLERRFPGVVASEDGLTFSKPALAWMKDWKP
jgi:hypothetical protein